MATAEAIAGQVKAAGLVTAVGYHWRQLDLLDLVMEYLVERPPLLVAGYWLDRTPPAAWWARRSRSGGQMIEQTTHLFDLARLLVGEVTSVQAMEVAAVISGDGD